MATHHEHSVKLEQRITLEVEKYRPVSGFSYELTFAREFVWTIRLLRAGPVRLRFAANGSMLAPTCKIRESKKEEYQITPNWRVLPEKSHGKFVYESLVDIASASANTTVRISSAFDDRGLTTRDEPGSIFSLILLISYFGADPDWPELEEEYVEYTLPKGTSIVGSNPSYRPLGTKEGRARVGFYVTKPQPSAHIVISIPSVLYLFLSYFLAQFVFGALVLLHVIGWLDRENAFVTGAPTTILALIGQIYAVRNARESFYLAVGSWLVPFIAAVQSSELALWLSIIPIAVGILGLTTFYYDERKAIRKMNESFPWWAGQRQLMMFEKRTTTANP